MSHVLERDPRDFDRLIRYGNHPQQFAELRLPDGQGPFPLLFVIHGGFWQNKYDLSHISHFCAALTRKDIVTCSLEYRRLGDSGGGWPGTFHDVSLGTDRIMEKLSSDTTIDPSRTGAVGHSAGGHLALWLVSRHNIAKASPLYSDGKNRLSRAVSLAGVNDLREAWKERLGNGATTRLIGGTPDKYPDRYNAGSPIELLPSGARVFLVHGSSDTIVPIEQSEKFFDKAVALGDNVKLVRLEEVGHFELIDPLSAAWARVEQAILLSLVM
jgi:dipeptidyl aminopeptidase/acylaminoacyl peptidase